MLRRFSATVLQTSAAECIRGRVRFVYSSMLPSWTDRLAALRLATPIFKEYHVLAC